MNQILENCKRLVCLLNYRGIPWVIYKGKYHYMDGFGGVGDVDILIRDYDIETVHEILNTSGFVHVKTQTWFVREGVEDWIGFDDKTGKLAHIHLHTRIVFGNPFVNQYRFRLEKESLMYGEEDENGIRSQNAVIESILAVCMYVRRCVEETKYIEYREGVKGYFYEAIQNKEIKRLISEEDKRILFDYISGSLIINSNVRSFTEKYCCTEIKNWRIHCVHRLIQYEMDKFL